MMLFTPQSTKISKTLKVFSGYRYYIQYLMPRFNLKENTCPFSTEACRRTCLQSCGRLGWDISRNARAKRTDLYFNARKYYDAQLELELMSYMIRAVDRSEKLVIRLNGTSDIDYSHIWKDGKWSDIIFNEYTKNHILANQFLAFHKEGAYLNVNFTLSFSGKNLDECLSYLKRGGNVAVVFEKYIPDTFMGFKVINGDEHDFRFKDEPGVIVGLIAKAPIGSKETKRTFIQNGIDGGFIIQQQ